MKLSQIVLFAEESNRIEGIVGDEPRQIHADALDHLLDVEDPSLGDITHFVSRIEPQATLRTQLGQDVIVGDYRPPRGGPEIRDKLILLLNELRKLNTFDFHVKYESLHPWTDGNGRSGRALWLWQMVNLYGYRGELLFLHAYYYQALDASRIVTA